MCTALQLPKCLARNSATSNLGLICACQCFNISLLNIFMSFDSRPQMEVIDQLLFSVYSSYDDK